MPSNNSKLSVALDWTPNTIHAGLYVAQEKGWFKEKGLDVDLIPTDIDNYSVYPIEKAAQKQVDIGMCPTEHVLYYNFKEQAFPLVAIGAVFQEEMSAYIYYRSHGIKKPRDLDGKTYACYNSKFEKELLSRMIQKDGGQGQYETLTPNKLEVWDHFLKEDADIAWIFKTWEGVDAERKEKDISYFHLYEYGIPYGYSPVFTAHKEVMDSREEALSAFMQTAERGYQFATEYPGDTANLLCDADIHANFKDRDFILLSMTKAHKGYLDKEGKWGRIHPDRWNIYVDWLQEHDLLLDAQEQPVKMTELEHELFNNQLF